MRIGRNVPVIQPQFRRRHAAAMFGKPSVNGFRCIIAIMRAAKKLRP